MKPQYITVKIAELNNHCPECYSTEGLQLIFNQRYKETKLYKAITNDTFEELRCKVCQTDIFPVRWNDDIGRVVDYQKKAFQSKPRSFKLKPLAWVLFLTIDVLIILGILVALDVIKF